MRNLLTAILCVSLSALAGAQASSGGSSAGSQGTATAPKDPTAIIETTDGNITCTLFPDQAPVTVANFIGLANGTKAWKNPKTGQMMHTPLYDGTICHRVIPNFMIQCGDPAGNGTGGPRYAFKDEVSSGLTFNQPGRLAMANSGPDTNGSQFFVTEAPYPSLTGHRSAHRPAVQPAEDHSYQDHRPWTSGSGNEEEHSSGKAAVDWLEIFCLKPETNWQLNPCFSTRCTRSPLIALR